MKKFRVVTNGHVFQVQEKWPGLFSKWEETWAPSGPLGLRAWPAFKTREEAMEFMAEQVAADALANLPWKVVK